MSGNDRRHHCLSFSISGRGVVFIGVESSHARTFRIKHGISHTFNEDAKGLIVENRDTVEADSWFVGLSGEQQKQVIELTIKLLQKAIKLGEKAIDYQIKRKRILLCTCADLTGVSVTSFRNNRTGLHN